MRRRSGDEVAPGRVRRLCLGAVHRRARGPHRARPGADRALRRKRPGLASPELPAWCARRRRSRRPELPARRLHGADRGRRALRRRRSGEHRPRRGRRRPHSPVCEGLRGTGRPGRDRERSHLSALRNRRAARRRGRGRLGSRSHLHLPPQQPDRGARRAPVRAAARRRRGVLRVRGRHRVRAHRRRGRGHPDVLEGLRARGRARGIRPRGRGDSRRAEPPTVAGAHLHAVGGARPRRARRPAGRLTAGGGA